jgi:broad specificity phosphatase PhoE
VARLHLVRHGRAAAAWTDHLDPGLDEVGAAEAAAAAQELAGSVPEQPVWSSPLLRTRETAAPLAAAWGSEVVVVPAFGEVPSPSQDAAERGTWLAEAMVAHWADLGPVVDAWRTALLDAVRAASSDVVVFTHFVAINAVVAAAEDRPEVMVFAPANGSITVIDTDRATGALVVVRRGQQATPRVG